MKKKEQIVREKKRILQEHAKIEKLKEAFEIRKQNISQPRKEMVAVDYFRTISENCKIPSFLKI